MFGLAAGSASAQAQGQPVSLRDSFPLGRGGDTLCQVQNRASDDALISPFDRAWAIVCRDSALPVGYVFALRPSAGDVEQRLMQRRSGNVTCADTSRVSTDISGISQQNCTWSEGGLGYSILRTGNGRIAYFAEGFSAYQDALELALQSVVEDRIVEGDITIVTTSVNDSVAFARIQALTLDPDQALAEGYRRNNSGDYAAASEFFETLAQRLAGDPARDDADQIDPLEFLINQALQKSNLGDFLEADALFEEAASAPTDDIVLARLLRNYQGIHLINQRRYTEAIERLNRPISPLVDSEMALREQQEITFPVAMRINTAAAKGSLVGFVDELKLTPQERAAIIDAQALHLVATAQRLNGNPQGSETILVQALDAAVKVRDGRVVSIIRLRAQILFELAQLAEDRGDIGQADTLLNEAIALIAMQYPETRALNAARARYASFLARQGSVAQARMIYAQVVENALGRNNAMTGFANQFQPYFDILVAASESDASIWDEFFAATQVLVRPGVAETQAILARELSSGSDEGARLFRLSNNLNRSIERLRIRLSSAAVNPDISENDPQLRAIASKIADLEAQQQGILVKLAAYPQYTAVANRAVALQELSDILNPQEAYARLIEIGGALYIFYHDDSGNVMYKADISAARLERQVETLRDTISQFDPASRQFVTIPYDVETARAIFVALFAPIADRLLAVNHLIFEPDGALLRLPIELLITDDASVDRYMARAENLDSDPFDVSDVVWLARNVAVTTAVSARAFVDARRAPSSQAQRQYLGLGENAAVFGATNVSGLRGVSGASATTCDWPLGEWNKPISAAELRSAQSILGAGASEVVTGSAFTDSLIKERQDIDDFRILHFATHGLVSAPRPECPARPALLTSFGDKDSDGLLTFQEIFDLRLDADLVILSACDTAGRATVAATREVGLTTGGGGSLDGLVRSFVGAGGRSVIASHWPAPDDFDATQRLITGLFEADAGTMIWQAINASQRPLMDDPLTSHPYYWAGFAIVGDGARTVVSADQLQAAD